MPSFTLSGTKADTNLYFRLEGREGAPRLLLLHPVGADHSLWDAVVPELARDFQILRPDLRGHGGSGTSTVADYDVALLTRDVLSLCDALGWDRFAACGVSVGGMIVLHMSATTPDRVSDAILCSSAAHMDGPPNGWQDLIDSARANGIESMASGMVERMFSQRHRATNDPLVDTLRHVFRHTDPMGYAASLAALRDVDLRPALPSINIPVLVVTGSVDPLIPAAATQLLQDSLPNVQHIEMDAGHFPPVEAPAAFISAVRTFLRV